MIKVEELEHLANLARVNLTEDDKKSLIKEFDSILAYVDQLKKVNVSMDVEGRVGVVRNVMRDDVSFSIDDSQREMLLDEAPDRVDDFIAVKKIIEQ
jgi:aspartyl-tRNA(Asn)/glutamyl-tRNA(Gln) amidotransferase subunit C